MTDLERIHIQLELLESPELIDQRKQWALHSACAVFRHLNIGVSTGSDLGGQQVSPPAHWPAVMIREPELLDWKPVGVMMTERAMLQAAGRGIETWIVLLESAVGDLLSSGLSVVGVAQGANRRFTSTHAFVQWAQLVIGRAARRQVEAA